LFCLRSDTGWEIRKNSEYRIHASTPRDSAHTQAHFLLQVNAEGHAAEGFRFALDGASLDADFWAKDVLDIPQLKRFRFKYEVRPEDIDLRTNAFTSKWEDLDDLLAHETVSAFEADSNEEENATVRKILESAKSTDKDLGASLRWSLQSNDKKGLKLVLQSLPRPANRLKKDPRLAADSCSTIHLQTFPVNTLMCADFPCLGPQPVLFARDPEAVQSILKKSPEAVHTGRIIFHLKNTKYVIQTVLKSECITILIFGFYLYRTTDSKYKRRNFASFLKSLLEKGVSIIPIFSDETNKQYNTCLYKIFLLF